MARAVDHGIQFVPLDRPPAYHHCSDFADAAIVFAAQGEGPGYVLTFDEDFRSCAGVTVLPDR